MSLWKVRILGSGSSGGVPRIDGDWGACDPYEPKNRRRRCSILVERAEKEADFGSSRASRVLVDTSPDLREQWLDAGAPGLDAVVFTHDHADQTHGLDDLRALVYRRRARLPAYMNAATRDRLMSRFGYIFETPEGSGYPPILEHAALPERGAVALPGSGPQINVDSFPVEHGDIVCAGLRFGPIVYTPDVSGIDEAGFDAIAGAGLWVVDALRWRPHPTHADFDTALKWLARARPGLGVLTNLHVDMDYRETLARCPDGVRPAYDGLEIVLSDAGALLHADPA